MKNMNDCLDLSQGCVADTMSSSKKRPLSGEGLRSEDDKRACSADRLQVPAPAPASSAACVSNSPPKVSSLQSHTYELSARIRIVKSCHMYFSSKRYLRFPRKPLSLRRLTPPSPALHLPPSSEHKPPLPRRPCHHYRHQ